MTKNEMISSESEKINNGDNITKSGEFVVGCNYWASHAGMLMWSKWDEAVVKEDFRQLSENGLQVLRVFPLWPDFQPLTRTTNAMGHTIDLRFGEEPLPLTEAGQAGVDETMMQRFETMADYAQEYGLQLIVGLITGWMSGRLFIPTAFNNKNVITDPEVIKWQTRFVRYFVKSLKHHPAICGWDLGNECNCMAPADRDQAWCWANTISSAIRVEDQTRPVVSGMHSLTPAKDGQSWKIQDQGELTDLLTTHPYPLFTPHCNQEPLNRLRNCLHATAESRMYADISGKPCIAEELGNLGPNICSDRIAAEYARTALFSLWANDCQGFLWWCAYDQDKLTNSPYDWNAIERELGLVTSAREPKPVIKEIKKFADVVHSMPFKRLPKRKAEAVCILTEDSKPWTSAFSAFILAKQAGFDLEFVFVGQKIPEAQLYIVPSVAGVRHSNKELWDMLYAKAEKGASIYVSCDDGVFSPFKDFFGAEVISREIRNCEEDFDFGDFKVKGKASFKLNLEMTDAEVIGKFSDGKPALIRRNVGNGHIYFLGMPLEKYMSETKDSFAENNDPAWKIYRIIGKDIIEKRSLKITDPMLCVTEHKLDSGEEIAIIINGSEIERKLEYSLKDNMTVNKVLYGESNWNSKVISPNNAIVIGISGC